MSDKLFRLEESLVQELLYDSKLIRYIKNNIYPVVIPEFVNYPCIVYKQTVSNRTMAINHGDDKTGFFYYEFTSYSKNYSTCKQVSLRLKQIFSNFHGYLNNNTECDYVHATRIITNNLSSYDDIKQIYSITQEFTFFVNKT